MKIVLITGSLNQGGAEYQLLSLARLLKEHGHDVEVVAITDYDYYLPFIKEHSIPYSCVSNEGSNLSRLFRAVKLIRSKKPDVAISYIKRVSQVAILARVLSGFRFRLIISERTSQVQPWHDLYYFNLALLANRVTVNSLPKYNYIRRRFPLLKSRTVFIPNLLDTGKFLAVERKAPEAGVTRLSYVGRISPEKNLLNLIRAVKTVKENGHNIILGLYGEANNAAYLSEVNDLIASSGLKGIVRYMGPSDDISVVYSATDLLCLVSYYEGFSNVLAEALAAGIPVISSDIEENRLLIENEVNGFLVNPKVYTNISDAIEQFLSISKEKMLQISKDNRKKAEQTFKPETIYAAYSNLLP